MIALRRRRAGHASPLLVAALALLAAACGASPGGADPGAAPAPAAGTTAQGTTASPDQPWPVKTRYVADLWLHGYAMLLDDTARVPLFERGYRDRMIVRRNVANASTMLDANHDRLAQRLRTNPALQGSQFLALYFGTWEQLQDAIDAFLDAEGNPRAARSQREAQIIGFLAANFPTAADREWLRLYARSLEDESRQFYESWWTQAQRERAPVVAAVDSLWQRVYRPRFQRYLSNTQQSGGDFYLSLPLGGEGRAVRQGERTNVVAVAFPSTADSALVPIYVFAHEVAGAASSIAVRDNLTPAEVRSGAGERLEAVGLVRGGAMLLARIAPELVDGYARYYLNVANVPVTGDPREALAAAFPLPEAVRAAIEQQLDITLGGI